MNCCCSVTQSCPTLAAPWTAVQQTSLPLTISRSLSKFISISSVIQPSHLILWHPLLLLPSIFPSVRDFPNQLAVHIRWPKYWNFSFNISTANEYSALISFKIDWFGLLAVHTNPPSKQDTNLNIKRQTIQSQTKLTDTPKLTTDTALPSRKTRSSSIHQNTNTSYPNQETFTSHRSNLIHREHHK